MWELCALVCLSICSHFTAGALFYCPPCSQMSPCNSTDGCPGGVVYERCGCCKVCAKVEGESCAGHYLSEGLCDENLKCTVSEKHSQRGELNETGICLRKSGWWMYRYTSSGMIICCSRARLPRKLWQLCFLFHDIASHLTVFLPCQCSVVYPGSNILFLTK